ncbi:ABC transporter permease [Thermaerobacter marianensis]|uniref:ABC transporter permease n=1 Tax=Thermaerobacter marianensis TaxID=73919 RepID=UPI001FA77009|nr:ABC transporter permease [Thermaerobacter marianensis]
MKRPLNLLWLLAVPLFFGVLGAGMFLQSGQVPVLPVVVEDRGPWVDPLLRALEATPMQVRRLEREEAIARIHQGRERVVLWVPPDFSRSVDAGAPRLELWHGPRYEPGLEVARIRAVAAGLVTGTPAGTLPVAAVPPRPTVEPREYQLLRAVFGFYAMFALVTLITQAAALHRERALGTLSRTLVNGATYGEVVAGHAAALFLIGLLQAAAMLGVTALMGAPWLAAGLPALALAVVATLVAACGIALAAAGFTHTSQQIHAVATLVGTIAAMLGGAFWPLDVVPSALQEVARLSPVYWALDAVREAFVFGGPGAAQGPAVAVLFLVGLLAGTAGVMGLRRWAV